MSDETQVQQAQASETKQVPNQPTEDGGGNGSDVAELKDILGPVFGTQFKSNEDALKSVESAKNMAGKVGQLEKALSTLQAQQQTSTSPELESKISQLETLINQQSFYAENPDYNTPEAKALIAKFGTNPSEVIKDDVFKTAFNAIKSVKQQEASKSVLMSNPRLGQAQDKITAAKEAVKSGNYSQAAESATAAVMEAFDIK